MGVFCFDWSLPQNDWIKSLLFCIKIKKKHKNQKHHKKRKQTNQRYLDRFKSYAYSLWILDCNRSKSIVCIHVHLSHLDNLTMRFWNLTRIYLFKLPHEIQQGKSFGAKPIYFGCTLSRMLEWICIFYSYWRSLSVINLLNTILDFMWTLAFFSIMPFEWVV